MRRKGAEGLSGPLSAQAHAPDRPSGADKKEVQNECESRPGRFGRRGDRAELAANRHLYPLHAFPAWPRMVNEALALDWLERDASSGWGADKARLRICQQG